MSCPEAILRDVVHQGERITVTAQPKDGEGVPIAMDETWQARGAVCRGVVGGDKVLDIEFAIADGIATGILDTSTLEPGIPHFYDVLLTDPDGEPMWTDPVVIEVSAVNTPQP